MRNAVRWRRARQAVQALSVALFFLLALLTFHGSTSLIPLDLYFRLDPLTSFGAMLAMRAVVTSLLLSVAAILFALVFGRAWCGWLCPLGALLDWFSPRNPGKIELHPSWRLIKYAVLVVIVVAAALGNLSFMVFDPITLLNRTVASAVIPGLNVLIGTAEPILYNIPPLQDPIDSLELAARGTVLPATQTFYQLGGLLALVLAAVIALNWVVPRFWCRYVCPLGGGYALAARVAFLRPHAVQECDRCARCVHACPTGAISVNKQGFKIDAAECILCLDCTIACPLQGIDFRLVSPFGRQAAAPSPRLGEMSADSQALTRRQAVGSVAFGVAAVALFRSAAPAKRDDPFLIRPPGARENGLLEKCIRCAECVRTCPTGGLQPSALESGVEGLWTPVLVSRLGYCDYSCNACGQVCPTGAIPPLTLEEKRQKVLGVAFIDTNRCIPYATFHPCIVCQEVCPIPEKAIWLEQVDVTTPSGESVHLQRPHVIQEKCIGCGICEYQCPLSGPAAIRVYAPVQLPALQTG